MGQQPTPISHTLAARNYYAKPIRDTGCLGTRVLGDDDLECPLHGTTHDFNRHAWETAMKEVDQEAPSLFDNTVQPANCMTARVIIGL